jgi:hypothetical protein
MELSESSCFAECAGNSRRKRACHEKQTYLLIFTVEGDNEIEGPDDMDNDDGNDGHDEGPGDEEGVEGVEDVNEQLDENQTPDKSGEQRNLPPSPADKKCGAQSWVAGDKNKTCYNSFETLPDCELIDEEKRWMRRLRLMWMMWLREFRVLLCQLLDRLSLQNKIKMVNKMSERMMRKGFNIQVKKKTRRPRISLILLLSKLWHMEKGRSRRNMGLRFQ